MNGQRLRRTRGIKNPADCFWKVGFELPPDCRSVFYKYDAVAGAINNKLSENTREPADWAIHRRA